jgi:hypothetical protein
MAGDRPWRAEQQRRYDETARQQQEETFHCTINKLAAR